MLATITMVLLFFEWCDRGLLSSEVSGLLQRHTLPRAPRHTALPRGLMNPITQWFLHTFEPIMAAVEPNTAATSACIRVAEFFWPPGRPLRGLTGPHRDEIWARIYLVKELACAAVSQSRN